ncbi:MAG: RdgB/HAM1 family non-canonical purine NTP pyrophosphatase [Candidatus Omnitrophica bacterium]|nr:RdgB/HAM1 family non-canonical purine NTP pyrophosphatase [Candidatus Omnitrophota bacterium]
MGSDPIIRCINNMQLVVATKNKKKLEEIKAILKDFDLDISSLADYKKTPVIIENGKTFNENAIKKAVKIARFSGKLSLGEDSGLCVDVLHGAPGIYSARFSGKGKSDAQNNLKLLSLLDKIPVKKRKAYYVCAVALANKDGLLGVVEGKCSGRIGFELKGECGFGYDPLFIIPKYNKTFAQLGEKIKHKMSHRYHALKKARIIIEKYIEKD